MPVLILVALAAAILFGLYRFRIGFPGMSPVGRLAMGIGIIAALLVVFYFTQGHSHV